MSQESVMPPPPGLTQRLWDMIAGLYDQIVAHPFLAGLADGSLDQERFRFYVVQDALYLRDYARALSVCGARAPAEDDVAMFNRHAAGAIAVERELHAGFLADLGLTPAEVEASPMAPTNKAYTSYLLASVYAGSFAEALAAVLPCYWIYAEVGAHLLQRGSPDPSTSGGSTPTAARSSPPWSRPCVTSPTGSAPTSARPSWPGSTSASPPPAATSGCSGTPPGARSAGPSRAAPARRGRRRPGG
jgi:thiaminase